MTALFDLEKEHDLEDDREEYKDPPKTIKGLLEYWSEWTDYIRANLIKQQPKYSQGDVVLLRPKNLYLKSNREYKFYFGVILGHHFHCDEEGWCLEYEVQPLCLETFGGEELAHEELTVTDEDIECLAQKWKRSKVVHRSRK